MQVPVMHGVIERRLLVNYRVDPAVLAGLLPAPFRPALVDGVGVAGICLIRLGDVRPRWAPPGVGLRSENAAHRIAVGWDTAEGARQGVYVPRRDTASRLNQVAGGRLFPGVHHRATFAVREGADAIAVAHAASSFFDDPARFPPGSVAFDSAFIMRDVPHEWHALPRLGGCGARAA